MDAPFTETFPLTQGGDLTLTRFFDGTHILATERQGMRSAITLSAADVWHLREATGGIVLAGLAAAFREEPS